MRLANLNIRMRDGSSLRREADMLTASGHTVELTESDTDSMDADPARFDLVLGRCLDSDLVILRITEDIVIFRRHGEFLDALTDAGVSLMAVHTAEDSPGLYRRYFRGSDDQYGRLLGYITLGGRDNGLSLLRYCCNVFDGTRFDVPEPGRPPAQGIAYPGREDETIDGFISELKPDVPTIGILVNPKKWNGGEADHVSALIDSIESRGCQALPVFLSFADMQEKGSIGLAGLVDGYLIRNGEPVVDAVINTMTSSIISEARARSDTGDTGFLSRLGVPVLNSPTLRTSESEWKEGTGLGNAEIAGSIALPEIDGQIISVPWASTEDGPSGRTCVPIPDRVDSAVGAAVGWARLRHIPNRGKKVAIILYNCPPDTSRAGNASDLDSFESVSEVLKRMDSEGYTLEWVPEDGRELADRMFAGITNDIEWVSDSGLKDRAAGLVSRDQYAEWFGSIPESSRISMREAWGEPPGDVMTVKGSIAIPGIIDGNVAICFQPYRGTDDYDTDVPPSHQYLAFYRWLEHVFGADALVHMGAHGSLEWLPGKRTGLSGECCPDYILDGMPNLYPYVVSDPGKGAQAKRRSRAVIIDHMTAPLARSGPYGRLQELDGMVRSYLETVSGEMGAHRDVVLGDIRRAVTELGLEDELGLPADFSDGELESSVGRICGYLSELKSNSIKDGLHVFGKVPEGDLLVETIVSMLRVPNGDVPSLQSAVASSMGLDWDALRDDPSGTTDGRVNSEMIDSVEEKAESVVRGAVENGFDPGMADSIQDPRLRDVVRFMCNDLREGISGISNEMDSLMKGLDGRYVEPGPSGNPFRGRADLLPTGRNFFTVDPEAVPTPASWEMGKRMADRMVERYLDEKGLYPDTVAMVLWSTDTMKTGGDDISYALSLYGVRPVWEGYGEKVTGLEVLSIEEMGHPRVDVTITISGLFRDTFPHISDLIDRAVSAVAALDEKDEDNAVRAHIREDTLRMIESGIPEDEARKLSGCRMFGTRPGQYSPGVASLVSSSGWDGRGDIGDMFTERGGFAYGSGMYGTEATETFRNLLSRAKVAVKNCSGRDSDIFDNDDVFQFLGGLSAAIESVSGERPMSLIGDSSESGRPVLRTVGEEARFLFRSKLMNPKYSDGLKRHGFSGAAAVLDMFRNVYGWDATSDTVDDRMYDGLAERYVLDPENRQWIQDSNPFAMHDMIDTLMEANARGMWDASEEMLEKLKEVYSENEEILEEMTDGQ